MLSLQQSLQVRIVQVQQVHCIYISVFAVVQMEIYYDPQLSVRSTLLRGHQWCRRTSLMAS